MDPICVEMSCRRQESHLDFNSYDSEIMAAPVFTHSSGDAASKKGQEDAALAQKVRVRVAVVPSF
jgi:hypothetical protein